MLCLSVVVAVLGLSLNSGAVVIGAMLIAPFMTPVLGASAALVMAWPRRLGQSMVTVLAGTAGSVGISYAITSMLPSADQVLTPEVLSRSSPDLRDLLVALAAGAAGAYATAREDVSAALPGVAVAVALVPPLATTGFTLAIGRADLARGAFLLFLANLVAIMLAGALVLLASGFVPAGRRDAAPLRIRLGLLATAIATATVAVPLTAASLRSATAAQRDQAVNEAVASWLTPSPTLKLSAVKIQGADVTATVVGPTSPPPSSTLAAAVSGILGPNAAVQVRWYQSAAVSAPTNAASRGLTLSQLQRLVTSWLAAAPGGASSFRVLNLTTSGSTVGVQLEGVAAPPPAAELARAISRRDGQTMTVSVSWTTDSFLTTQQGVAAENAVTAGGSVVRATAAKWVASHPGVVLLGAVESDAVATIDLATSSASLVTPDLKAALAAALGPKVKIVIRFAKLALLSP